MRRAESFKSQCKDSKSAAKIAVNILLTTFLTVAALIFAVYGYNYRGLPFISQYYSLLLWLTVGGLAALLIAYLVTFVIGIQSI